MSKNLNNLKASEIVSIYNQAAVALGLKTVNRFSNKETAVRRTNEILAQLPAAASEEKAPSAKRNGPINLPFRGQLHKIRKNTLNERVLFALRAGTDMDELTEITAAFDREAGNESKDPRERARATVRMLHTYTGLGIATAEDGTMTVIED